MDTRAKIVEATAVKPGMRVVSGYFDPLLAEDAQELAALAEDGVELAVVILDPPNPILAARARAELVAALGCVGAVVTGTGIEPEIHLEAGHARRAAAFAEHVRERQR